MNERDKYVTYCSTLFINMAFLCYTVFISDFLMLTSTSHPVLVNEPETLTDINTISIITMSENYIKFSTLGNYQTLCLKCSKAFWCPCISAFFQTSLFFPDSPHNSPSLEQSDVGDSRSKVLNIFIPVFFFFLKPVPETNLPLQSKNQMWTVVLYIFLSLFSTLLCTTPHPNPHPASVSFFYLPDMLPASCTV